MSSGYSYTSNTVKLFKHLDVLNALQHGIVQPIMVHSIPTHKCQLSCVHCCFKNRDDMSAEMDWNVFREAVTQFKMLGTKAWEFTGGGDPLLWSHFDAGVELLKLYGFHIGVITNGIAVSKYGKWNRLDWVRVSLNTLEYRDDINISSLLGNTRVSFCYIWHDKSEGHIEEVVKFSNKHRIMCRLAPDCIHEGEEINRLMEQARSALSQFKDNQYVFLSDFNVSTERRALWDCRLHMIKPCLYLDGFIYSCPSAELAMENDRKICADMRLCGYKDIVRFYRNGDALSSRARTCSYCKYAKQQDILDMILTETEFNEFA